MAELMDAATDLGLPDPTMPTLPGSQLASIVILVTLDRQQRTVKLG